MEISNEEMGKFAIGLSIVSITFWIIHYFIIMDAAIIIAVIFPCIIFGLILAISNNQEDKDQGIHPIQKIALIMNLAFIGYLIVSQILIEIFSL